MKLKIRSRRTIQRHIVYFSVQFDAIKQNKARYLNLGLFYRVSQKNVYTFNEPQKSDHCINLENFTQILDLDNKNLKLDHAMKNNHFDSIN